MRLRWGGDNLLGPGFERREAQVGAKGLQAIVGGDDIGEPLGIQNLTERKILPAKERGKCKAVITFLGDASSI